MSAQNAPFFADNEVIVLAKNGVWLSDGVEITHELTHKMFSANLHRDGEGYVLRIGNETKRIIVEDTAWFIQRIEGSPETEVELWTTAGTSELLDPTRLKYRPGRLTCRLKNNEEAKFLHAAYFDLLKHLHEDNDSYFLLFADGRRVDLGLKTS